MVLKDARKINVWDVPNIQFGDGVFNGSTPVAIEGCPVEFHYCKIEKGSSVGKHYHNEETEYYYVLSGQGEYDDNGNVITLKPGDISTCGGGQYHSVINQSDEPFVFVGIISKH